MKIALVCPYDFATPGGVQDHVAHLSARFRELGHTVKILTSSSDEQSQTDGDVYALGGVRGVPANGSIARITLSMGLAKRVKQILRSERFDVVHLHEPLLPMLPLTVLRLSDAVNVGTFHAYSEGSYGYLWGRSILMRYFRRLDGCIAVSPAARTFAAQYFPANYAVIPNGIDTAEFMSGARPIPEFCDGKLNMLFFGRLEKRKGLRYLLRAYPLIKSAFPNVRLIVAGEGTARSGYQQWVAKNNIRDIVFTGRVSNEDRARVFASADVFCAPNTGGESFGLVLLEAMAAGKPVVASAIPGYTSVVTDGTDGLLFPPKDSQALSTTMCRVLADSGLRERLGAAGQAKSSRYDWNVVADSVLAYYQQASVNHQSRTRPQGVGMPALPATMRYGAEGGIGQ